MLVPSVSARLIVGLIWNVMPSQDLYVIENHAYYTGIYVFIIVENLQRPLLPETPFCFR